MTDQTWHRVFELFHGSLERNTAERAAYLAEQCGADDVLRRAVLRLLEAHDGADTFLEEPAAAAVAREAGDDPGEGDLVGPYRLRRLVGAGGMGLVYEAEPAEGPTAAVALKLIRAGIDTAPLVARFESERRALALLRHPNVARVLDAGVTGEGRPYFVMEYVPGPPITEYCDRERLPLGERLALFADVCAALQHAHETGIIHRDVKPSNVLVTAASGRAVPKVIDFGIAKLTRKAVGTTVKLTALGSFMGTPEYMSPEQAGVTAAGVDARADVFSLGVLLYELLAGRVPFRPETFRGRSVEEIQRILREEIPPRASTRLAALAPEKGEEVARHRRTTPAALLQTLRGGFDELLARTMEKDPSRRPASVAALAAELERLGRLTAS
jgi:eukaryotic-like serine/threonine-protein kinase